MSERDFMLKYRLSRKTYDKYKKMVAHEETKTKNNTE